MKNLQKPMNKLIANFKLETKVDFNNKLRTKALGPTPP